jgi:molybdenum cofactor guanylyltransferase
VTLAIVASSKGDYDRLALTAGGCPVFEILRNTLSGLFGETLLVTPAAEARGAKGVRPVADIREGRGMLSGIHAALRSSTNERCFVLAADMPFVRAPLVAFLLELAPHFDVVCTDIDGFLEPCFASYSRRCLPHLEKLMTDGAKDPRALFSDAPPDGLPPLSVRKVTKEEIDLVDPDCLSLINLNTRDAVFNMNRFLPAGSQLDIKDPETPARRQS